MIPSDLAARLRVLTASSIQPLAPVQEITPDLPPYSAGQQFSARIESKSPDGTYRASVGGKILTLALPQPAEPGGLLDLVVIERTPQLIAARPLDSGLAPASSATLSRAGQLIGALLGGENAAVPPAPLAGQARGAALLSQPPHSGTALVPLLQQAVSESGVFYEAHQVEWLNGKLPLESLLREPQARLGATVLPAEYGTASTAGTATTSVATAATAAAAAPLSGGTGSGVISTSSVPADLVPIVQQQLEAAAQHCIAWDGQIWPGQTLQWEIEHAPAEERRAADRDDLPKQWKTALRLTLPRLGTIDARLTLTAAGVTVSLAAQEAADANRLLQGKTRLASALDAQGVPLRGFAVEHEQ